MTKEDARIQYILDAEEAIKDLEEVELEQSLEREFKGIQL